MSAAALYVVFAFLDGDRLDVGAGGGHRADRRPGRRRSAVADDAAAAGAGGAAKDSATDTGRTLANLNAADYLGALIGGLVWPFALLPHLGMIRGAAATGIINLVAAGIVAMFLLRRVVSVPQLVTALCALAAALGLLVMLLVHAHDIETTSRQRLYADPIIAYRHTVYQEIVVTRRGNDTRLYLDGGLQFSTRDEYRYTESLVYPALGEGARSVLGAGRRRRPGGTRAVAPEGDR